MDLSHNGTGRQEEASWAGVPDAWTVYDAAGNRVATKVNNIWRYVVYDAMGKLVAEYGEKADGLGGVKYIQQDWQGSVRTVTNSNGFAVARTDHQAFGGDVGYGVGQRSIEQGYNRDAATTQGYGLTERDEASGLDHTWFRKNENSAGRWTSPDPYKGSMNLADPQGFNRYSYVTNDPVNFVDPSGLDEAAPIVIHSWTWREWDEYWGPENGGDFGWLYDPPGPGIESGGGSGGNRSQDRATPCAKMAARAQKVAEENVKEQIKNTPRGKSTYAVALPYFDYNFTTLYTGHRVDGSLASISALSGGGGVNSAAADERGQQDFKEKFLDADFPRESTAVGADQVHHFAAYFSAGLNGAALSSYGHMMSDRGVPRVGRGVGNANQGDIALGNAAFDLGARIRRQPNLLYWIGDLIKNEFCL